MLAAVMGTSVLYVRSRAFAATLPYVGRKGRQAQDLMALGRRLLIEYFTEVADRTPWLARGHLDNINPPREIGELEPLIKRLAMEITSHRDPRTDLVPFSYDIPIPTCPSKTTTGAQSSRLVGILSSLFRYFDGLDFPAREGLQSIVLASATRFNAPGEGVYSFVDVETGAPRCEHSYLLWPLGMALGFHVMSRHMPQAAELLAQQAENILHWAVRPRVNPDLPLLSEQMWPGGFPKQDTCDSDTLYGVHALFEIAKLTGSSHWRKEALRYGRYFVENSWIESQGYCARKLNYADGKPTDGRLYDDAMLTIPDVMMDLFDATGARIWHDFFRLQTKRLMQIGEGWFPYAVKEGRPDPGAGSLWEQSSHLLQLCRAYHVFGGRPWIRETIADLAERLAEEPTRWRHEGGDDGRAFYAAGQILR
jgi:hypothetical protein